MKLLLLLFALIATYSAGCSKRVASPAMPQSTHDQDGASTASENVNIAEEQTGAEANAETEESQEIQAILADLKHEDWAKRRGAAKRFPFRAPLELRPAIPDLINSLESEHDSLALAAATALSSMADRETSDRTRLSELELAIEPLGAIIGGTAPEETRRWATIAISDIGVNLGPDAMHLIAPILIAAAADPSYDVSRFAMDGLGDFGIEARSAITTVIEQLKDADLRASVAAETLGKIGLEPERCVPALLKTLPKAQKSFVTEQIAEALGQFGEAASEAVTALIPLVSHDDQHLQTEVLMALAKIGHSAEPAIPEIERAFRNAYNRNLEIFSLDGGNILSRDVRLAALAALCACGPMGMERAKVVVQEVQQFEPCREVYDTKTLPEVLEVLAAAPNLIRLDLRGYDLADDDLIPLASMNQLEELIVPLSITDDGIRHVSKLPRLRAITFTGEQITHKGLAHFKEMITLKAIAIWGDGLTDEGLAHLQNSRDLEHLMLGSNNITDAGIPTIQRFANLQTLHLGSEKLTEQGISRLIELKKLKDMRLPKCIGDEGVTAIVKNHPELQYLKLDYSNVTLQSVEALKQLKHLKWLGVVQTPIASEYPKSAASISEALPNCEVQYFRRGPGIYDLFGK